MAARRAVDVLREAVGARTGLDFGGPRASIYDAALDRAARAAGVTAEARARALLAPGAALDAFVEELTVGETWFFRDAAQWAFVEDVILPDARARRAGRPAGFRAWSAGCSTGEEPYTLAMVLAEHGLLAGAHLVATDLNRAALAHARAAVYSVWSLRGDVGARARRWLREDGRRLAVAPEIARAVRFSALNLAEPRYPSQRDGLADLDLVLCRNVLIYLARDVIAEVAARLHASLAPGGWLLVGAADPSLARLAPFEVRAGPFGVAYRRPAAGVARGRRQLPAAARRAGGPGSPEAVAKARPPLDSGPAVPALRSEGARRPLPAEHSSSGPLPGGRSGRAERAPADDAASPGARELDAARQLLDAGRLRDGLAAIDAILARDPLDAAAHFERAVALTELGHPDAAEEACRRALYLSRDHPFVHFFVGLLRLARGDRAGAAAALRTARALAARLPPAELLTLGHGMTAGALAEAAAVQLARAEGDGPDRP